MLTLPETPITWFWKFIPHKHKKALAAFTFPLGDGYLGYCKRCNLWMEKFKDLEDARYWKYS